MSRQIESRNCDGRNGEIVRPCAGARSGPESDCLHVLTKAKAAAIAGRISEVIELLTDDVVAGICEIVADDASQAEIMYNLAITYRLTGRFGAAEEWYKKILAYKPYAHVYN